MLLAACGVTAIPAAWAANGLSASGGASGRPDLTVALARLGTFRFLRLAAYGVEVANKGSATQREVTVRIVLPRGLVPMRAGGPGWRCLADWPRNTENCQSTGPLPGGGAARFNLQVLVNAHTGALLTTRATVGSGNATALGGSQTTSVALVHPFLA